MIKIRCRSLSSGRSHATGTENVRRRFRLVASWFYDVRSYDWGLLVSEVSGDLAYTVAIERYTASRNGRPPVPTELRVTQCIGAWTDSGGGTPPRRPQATRATAATGTHADGFTKA